MEIIVAETAGFCFGVKRALEMVEDALKNSSSPISSLGPLIHNPAVVEDLENKGLQLVADIGEITEGRVVIRSHGVGPAVYDVARRQGLEIIDATCPFVKNVQQLAIFLIDQGYQVIIFGEEAHAEVVGVMESISGNALIIDHPTEIQLDLITPKVGVISQTTQDIGTFQAVIGVLVPLVKEIRVFNTICLATSLRQQEAAELSKKANRMIVVGGRNSANTSRLAEICRNHCPKTFQVESANEIKTEWFEGAGYVGVTAGASTPDHQIIEVIEKIRNIGGKRPVSADSSEQNPIEEQPVSAGSSEQKPIKEQPETIAGGEDAAYNWPDDHFRELVPGQIIEAKVILVRDDAAFVDIGGKSDLPIPLNELTSEMVTSAKKVVKVGDIVRVMVAKTGDEDKILLSKRLVDQQQVWFELEDAFKNGTILQGSIVEELRGGLSVNIDGIKAFMPASQAALGFVKELTTLVGQTFPVKIIEFDRSKKRVVVSRRVLLEVERKKAEAEFYGNITEGERRQGVITRLADFGAFVDIGSGIEGLVHVSEVSWNRVKTPAEVLTVGDQVEVLIIKVDPGTKRISLSVKQIQEHPWHSGVQKFEEGKVYPGTVVRMEPFGAFVRLAPGMDALAHISQIADRRITKPDEILKMGEEVQAKILKIDTANRKISVSLKEVGQDQNQQETSNYFDKQNEESLAQNLGDFIKK